RETCLRAGADDYVTKPIAREALVAALSAAQPLAANRPTSSGSVTSTEAPPDVAAVAAEVRARLAEQIGEDDPEFVREIATSFANRTVEIVERLRTAVAAGDVPEVGRAAHAVRSSALAVGLDDLASVATALDEGARQGLSDAFPEQMDRVDAAFARSRLIMAVLASPDAPKARATTTEAV
ncbi:MAG: response regulator, partial [Bacteroidota bacterium]